MNGRGRRRGALRGLACLLVSSLLPVLIGCKTMTCTQMQVVPSYNGGDAAAGISDLERDTVMQVVSAVAGEVGMEERPRAAENAEILQHFAEPRTFYPVEIVVRCAENKMIVDVFCSHPCMMPTWDYLSVRRRMCAELKSVFPHRADVVEAKSAAYVPLPVGRP